jgi:L-ascorbate metabolism protein UlaG (beta-lactamase superfamily)
MKLIYHRIFSVILLIVIASSVHGQAKEITIEFMGNCGLHLTDGETNIYVDFPYVSGAYGYMEYDPKVLDEIEENSIFIFTHKHADHYSGKILRKVMKAKGGKKYNVRNISKMKELSEIIPEFDIQAFKTKHVVLHIPFRHFSYLINWYGKKIYISGDTGNPETICSIKDIDWAFGPYWIEQNAREQGMHIDCKMFGVYHLYSQQIPDARQKLSQVDSIVPMGEPGEVITIGL